MSTTPMNQPVSHGPWQQARAFLGSRWNGQASMQRLFWWDTLAVATLLNAVLGLLAMILLAKGASSGIWLLPVLLIVPYNLFLVISIWRHHAAVDAMRYGSLLWLALTFAV